MKSLYPNWIKNLTIITGTVLISLIILSAITIFSDDFLSDRKDYKVYLWVTAVLGLLTLVFNFLQLSFIRRTIYLSNISEGAKVKLEQILTTKDDQDPMAMYQYFGYVDGEPAVISLKGSDFAIIPAEYIYSKGELHKLEK